MKFGTNLSSKDEIKQANLLIKSIKYVMPVADVYIVTGLKDVHIEDAIILRFELELNNQIYFYNKIQAASLFENVVGTPFVWLDIDSIVLKDLTPYFETHQNDIYLNPVDIKNIGIDINQPLSDIWQITLNVMQLELKNQYVNTGITNESIYPYYNIGMVFINEDKKVFTKTYETIKKMLKQKEVIHLLDDTLNQIFFHQVVFTLNIIKLYQEVLPLGKWINYPLHLIDKDDAQVKITDLITIRYDEYFKHRDIKTWLTDHKLKHIL